MVATSYLFLMENSQKGLATKESKYNKFSTMSSYTSKIYKKTAMQGQMPNFTVSYSNKQCYCQNNNCIQKFFAVLQRSQKNT